MMPWQQSLSVRLDAFHRQHCAPRPQLPCGAARDIARAVSTVLREVGAREPRFIISPGEHHPHRSPHQLAVDACEFEMLLYLNLQTSSGVFSLADEDDEGGGRALLKLADGRERSMSPWVEFITASGSLSASKLRSRLRALVTQALGRRLPCGRTTCASGEVLIGVPDNGVVKVTPAFRCSGAVWPRCASQWFPHLQWPGPRRMAEIKAAGFTLLPAEEAKLPGAAGAGHGDAWLLRFTEAEEPLLEGGCRRKCLSVLSALRERHLPGVPGGCLVRTLCEKHPRDAEWADTCLGERLLGALLRLSCLRCRRCPHFFVRGAELLRGLERAAERAWRLARPLIAGPASVDTL
uniref:Mab-21-like 2 n=1 Tax=Petromyzon marinus TaxID=7757 RepID=S4RM91_PETMA